MKTFTVIDNNSVEIDGVVYRKEWKPEPLPSEPEFNVGQWVKFFSGLYRITEIKRYNYFGECQELEIWSNEACLCVVDSPSVTIATPAEIESHLRKICDEKYVGKRVKCLSYGEYTVVDFQNYDSFEDTMWYNSGETDSVMVYQNGEWAAILADKKPLPETKDEYTSFLNLFSNKYFDDELTSEGMVKFLSDYDFND